VQPKRYRIERMPVKSRAEDAGDRVLVKLFANGAAEVLILTDPSPATRLRLRRFCRAVIETPSFPRLEAETSS
jgi:hypothetical protein